MPTITEQLQHRMAHKMGKGHFTCLGCNGYFAAGHWGGDGAAVPPVPSAATEGDKWIGAATLKRRLNHRELQAVKAFLEAELNE